MSTLKNNKNFTRIILYNYLLTFLFRNQKIFLNKAEKKLKNLQEIPGFKSDIQIITLII